MNDSELKMIADHMGHSVNIHTDVYRLQCSLIEKTKVAKILIAMENGAISQYQGKNLEAIRVEGSYCISMNKTTLYIAVIFLVLITTSSYFWILSFRKLEVFRIVWYIWPFRSTRRDTDKLIFRLHVDVYVTKLVQTICLL